MVGPWSQPAGPAIHTYVDSVVKDRWEESYSDKINFPPAYGCDNTLYLNAQCTLNYKNFLFLRLIFFIYLAACNVQIL